jgi:hypothetical protein
MQMRLRVPELLDEHKPPLTAYAVAKASGDRISLFTIYRLVRHRGRVANFDADLLEALCDVFEVGPGARERESTEASPATKARGERPK